MRYLERDLERVSEKLQAGPLADEERGRLYAAQQALAWALEPTSFKAPYDMIVGASIPAGSEDCPAGNGHSQFSDILDCHAP